MWRPLSKICIAVLFSLALDASVYPQTVLSEELEQLARYLGAATRFVSSCISSIDKVQAAQIRTSDREQAVKELTDISNSFAGLYARQTILHLDLSGYIIAVREQRLSVDERERLWASLLDEMSAVSKIVSKTVNVVENSKWLNVAVDAKDYVEIREVLRERSAVLTGFSRFSTLAPPSTSQEIKQLDEMNVYYKKLIDNLHLLNISLSKAIQRIKTG